MRLLWLYLVFTALLAGQSPRVGLIDFYGLRKIPEKTARNVLGLREGDSLPRSKSDVEEALERLPGVVRARLEAACCEDGKAILYAGIEEKGAPHFEYHLPPKSTVSLPEEIHETYVRFLAALNEAVRKGATAEDLSGGHSLMTDPACRALQEKFAALAKAHQAQLRDVLRNAADQEQRAIAAYVIGYVPRKHDVLDDLQYALRDPDDTVRNNAMRALGAMAVLAAKQPQLELRISATWFIEMLNSLVWSDRSTAAVVLVTLTEPREPRLLDHLRERALAALTEMARWKHLPHALPAFILLGRITGVPEKEIQDTWSKGERESVIGRAQKTPRK